MTTDTELTREQLIRHKLDLLLRTGQLLVESAADTNRIMRNMKRVAAFLGLPEEHLHIYVQYNMLMVNLSDDEHSFSKFQRCDKHGINMTTISLISKLSWKAIREDYSIEQYAEELEQIAKRPRNYTPWWPSAQVSLAADSVFSLVATGRPSSMLLSLLLSVCICVASCFARD